MDISTFNSKFKNSNNLSFLHLNIASLPKHFDDFTVLLDSLTTRFHVIGISETRLNDTSVSAHNLEIPGYSFLSTPTEAAAGGTALYIDNSLISIPRNDLSSHLYSSKLIESSFVEVTLNNQPNIIVACIYKHPAFPIPEFNLLLSEILDSIDAEGKKVIFLGDFNINLLDHDSNSNIASFIDTLSSRLILPTISLPTRIASSSKTLIDNILISPSKYRASSGNLTVCLSDHLPQFLVLETCVESNDSIKSTSYQDWSKFDRENFLLDFLSFDWQSKLCLDKKDPDFSFEIFYEKISSLIDKNVPTRKLTKKQAKTNLKPWLTKGIKASINNRNKFYNMYVRSKNETIKLVYHNKYKIYRNKIVDLIRKSKTNYYKQYFLRNLHNSKTIWKGINLIIHNSRTKIKNISLKINDKVETNPDKVVDHFNSYFSSIADKVRNKIPRSNKNFKSYLRNKQQQSLFFKPATVDKVHKIIISLNKDKTSGPNSIPVNEILRLIPYDLSQILSFLNLQL